jgi:16S rRNA (cytidine1402-2'-O)-methyltransferase
MRAIRILGEVDFVLCEDTRVSRNLLNHYNITTPTISYHQHSDDRKVESILGLLDQGKNLALVSDAGTPGISDPGGKLVAAALERFGDDIKIESVPGPSAVTAALSISGVPADKFIFLGFPPHKKGRQTFIKKIVESEYPVVVYESKHRIVKFLQELKELSTMNVDEIVEPSDGETATGEGRGFKAYKKAHKSEKKINLTSIVVCRELSKMHETVYRGELDVIIEKITAHENDQRGEFVVIIGK